MKKTVKEFRNQRIELRRILAYSVIMGISINIISGSLGNMFNLPVWLSLTLWIGIALAIIVISQIIELHRLNSSIKFECHFITNESEKNSLVAIPGYKIVEDMERFFKAAFSENPAYRAIWEESGLDKLKGRHVMTMPNDSKKLISEMIEYCVLQHFSTFIGDYYNTRRITEKTVEYSGEDIPNVLLKNRFLKLFSEEPKNRASFCNDPTVGVHMVDEDDTESKDKGTLVYMIGSNGAIYQRFNLAIPKGSNVYRKDDNTIEIDTKLFTLKYKFVFVGMSAFVEQDFYNYYLHMPIDSILHGWLFYIEIDVKYKVAALIKIWDWKYYNWLDEYLERISGYCDINQFYKNIYWNEAKTLIQILNTPKPLRGKD